MLDCGRMHSMLGQVMLSAMSVILQLMIQRAKAAESLLRLFFEADIVPIDTYKDERLHDSPKLIRISQEYKYLYHIVWRPGC